MRDINIGEELTHDYATIDGGAIKYEIPCNCGAPTCRGTISSGDWKKKEVQDKNKGYFATYIQKKIDGKLFESRPPALTKKSA